MKRRTLFKLLSLPALAAFWPRATAHAQSSGTPIYTDDLGTPDLAVLHDNDPATGITYSA